MDDARLLPALADAAGAARPLAVLVDCDTGLGRTGVATPAAAAELARSVAHTDGLRFEGFITYPTPPGAAAFLDEAVRLAAADGLESPVVSAGGTPGMWDCGALRPTLTEYRVGTYAFHDRATVAAGSATIDDVAMTVLATVISRPGSGRAILDAGSKSLTSDPGPDAAFGVDSRGARRRRDAPERGARVRDARRRRALELGDQVHVVPNHACVVSNLFERFVVVSGGVVVDEWPIARGR